jgi:hypothetical protein
MSAFPGREKPDTQPDTAPIPTENTLHSEEDTMSKTGSGLLVLCLLLVSVLIVAPSSAATVTITLDAGTIPPTVVTCGDGWEEAGVTLVFVPTTIDDCTFGACFFGIGGLDPNGVDLYPARLQVLLAGVPGQVLSAEVDVVDFCGVNCTRAFFYNGPAVVDAVGNTSVSTPETLSISTGGDTVDVLAVSSCEGACTEIRIEYQAPVPVEQSTWSAIKALYN